MNYEKKRYVGKSIQLYPGDTYSKFGVIVDVDDLGWTVKITKSSSGCKDFVVGQEYFINHATKFMFAFIK